VVTSPESSELIKYASNAFLAMKLSFINSIGALAETVGADVAEIAGGMGFDERIGPKFLRTGPGWGGSCFPKDTRALGMIAADNGVSFPLLEATTVSNDQAQDRVAYKVRAAAGGSLDGVQVALWGLTFKAGTDDLRDSPALTVAALLAAEGADLIGYDPGVPAAVPGMTDNLQVTDDPLKVASGAAALVVLTEWPEFRLLDWGRLAELVEHRIVIDTRNLLDADVLRRVGFEVRGIGRRATHALAPS
jgi:UDPglucose 6-dehydrogenase